jgi:hypothetical protein
MRKRKAYLLIELDGDEVSSILPPHLQAILSRPLVDRLTTRDAAPVGTWPGCETEAQRRERRTHERMKRVRKHQADAIARGELNAPEK